MEKIAIKRGELEKLEVKIKKLNQKRNRLVKDIELLEMQQKSEQYAALEISLKEKNLTISQLLEQLNKNN